MTGRLTDRRGRSKETKTVSEQMESLANFTLPDSLPAEEVNYPPLITRKVTANWKQILEESQQYQKEAEDYAQRQQDVVLKDTFKNKESDYIKEEVFTCLLPAIEETLNKAKIWDVLIIQKSFFNGIDWIVQYLWNNNPRYPDRACNPQHLFNMLWVKALLKKQYVVFYNYLVRHIKSNPLDSILHANVRLVCQQNDCESLSFQTLKCGQQSLPTLHNTACSTRGSKKQDTIGGLKYVFLPYHVTAIPRPYYPKSWLWTEDYAATMIQKTVRQYFVQRDEEVQEMREFWKKIKMEEKRSDIGLNPLLARKFASSRSLARKK